MKCLSRLLMPSLLSAVAIGAAYGWADVIRFKGGGEIEGQIELETTDEILIITRAGKVTVKRSEVASIQKKKTPREEYNERAATLAAYDVTGHLKLAQWCKKNRLRTEAKREFGKIIAADPDHEEARKELGYVRHDGMWLTEEEAMKAKGYVLSGGRWVLPEEASKLKEQKTSKYWNLRIRRYRFDAHSKLSKIRDKAIENIGKVDDEFAVGALCSALGDRSARVRKAACMALGNIGEEEALEELARATVRDDDHEVRAAALEVIKKLKSEKAMGLFVSGLGHRSSTVRQRCAFVLGELGDKSCVPALIEAIYQTPQAAEEESMQVSGGLNTRLWAPERKGMDTHNVGGTQVKTTRSGEVSVSMGGGKQKDEGYRHNPEAERALMKLTRQDFGVNKKKWREWWLKNKPAPGEVN